MNRAEWSWARFGVGLERGVPATPGVYAIARVERFRGLPLQIDYLYAGQSRNLRRRWVEHVDQLEPNPFLNRLARQENVEFWWIALPKGRLGEVEGDLIDRLQPVANRRRKSKAP